jgi:hypothetical protein
VQTIRPLAIDELARAYRAAEPFPFFTVDGFLEPAFAAEVAAAYPSYEEAARIGKVFESVHEHKKIQITEADRFPLPVRRLSSALADPEFLAALSAITGIERLLADDTLSGGGMHQTGPRGRLDVHVDFNLLGDRRLHRRLNILLYLNPRWEKEWGGSLELWDPAVTVRQHTIAPLFNRCVVFETSATSFHGVEAVACPPPMTRKSFAGYYYTAEAPAGWDGRRHGTRFRSRPGERLATWIRTPIARAGARWRRSVARLTSGVKRIAGS